MVSNYQNPTKLKKELEFKRWIANKKTIISANDLSTKDDMFDLMDLGTKSIKNYLDKNQ